MPVPPQSGADAADKINHHIPRIAGGAPQQVRADDFEKDGPKNGVERDFIPRWRIIDGAQAQSALNPKQHRQRARHEEQVIEMKSQEGAVRVRLDHPAVQHIQRAAKEEQTVVEIPKPFHSKTKIAKPKAVARSSFKTNIMLTTLPYPAADFQNIFLTSIRGQQFCGRTWERGIIHFNRTAREVLSNSSFSPL